ncbi:MULTISPECIES: magnesium transporter [Lachnospira]|jgi:magnesium transporter|uniref:Magnesium transporter MgtE n=1 Tax=Lachnospira multipara TaxID=28051 RepID=A0A1H5SRZ0_9FIRM|nr:MULTISPECIES: magnesium transporter [Lachnospira]SEF52748.1 magnesium transporter [Lachnospira multipara]
MMNEKNVLLTTLLENREYLNVRKELLEMNEVDVANFIEEAPAEEAAVVFRMLPKDLAADVFTEFNTDMKHHLVVTMTDQELYSIINDLAVDDAVDMLEEMPATVVERVLKTADPNMRNTINQFMQYKKDSAASVMTPEFIGLKEDMTVREAIDYIRENGQDSETIYTCYVMDAKRVLEGVVTVKTLLVSELDKKISEIMSKNVIFVTTDEDQEEAAKIISKYDFLALPVVDSENRLVGIITYDDAMDVMTEETTEDIERMGAMVPSETPYLKTPVIKLAKNRIVWLMVLMITDMISGGILASWQEAFTAMPILISFIPMLTDTGGNAGGQASTLIIRSLAMGEIRPKDWYRVWWKEARVAVICGFFLAVFDVARIWIMYPGQYLVGITIGIALFCTVVMAKSVGGILPLIAAKLKLDPAVMASPVITTIVDAGSLLIYLNTAAFLLRI